VRPEALYALKGVSIVRRYSMQFRMSALVLKQVLPGVKERGFGRIINIGSEVFELGNSRFANYVAAKGAQLGLTRSWAHELAPTGITVNLVAPGWIPTERHARCKPGISRELRRERSDEPNGYSRGRCHGSCFPGKRRRAKIAHQIARYGKGETYGRGKEMRESGLQLHDSRQVL
jgi:NAD(P)-dependent dehydrogenase (short-subunit alcohol dehydrogenase family)